MISEQKYGFMSKKSRVLMEKNRESKKDLHGAFVDLEKAYNRVSREELYIVLNEEVRISKQVYKGGARHI